MLGAQSRCVQPSLALEAEESVSSSRMPVSHDACAVAVADRDIALVPPRVVPATGGVEVIPDVAVGPSPRSVQLPAAIAQLEKLDVLAALGLRASQAREPGADVQLFQRALHRLDLGSSL